MTRPQRVLLRPPRPDITNDNQACNPMNALQLLYMAGLKEDVDLNRLNRQLGREPGDIDTTGVATRLLFDHGLKMHRISRLNLERALQVDEEKGYFYWLQCIGRATAANPRVRDVYRQWREISTTHFRAITANKSQVTQEWRAGNQMDLDRLLVEGWAVVIDEAPEGLPWIFFGFDADGYYQAYSPRWGISNVHRHQDMHLFNLRQLVAWKP